MRLRKRTNEKTKPGIKRKTFFKHPFFASGVGAPIYSEFKHYYTMILQRITIIVGGDGFEAGTSAQEVWCATNEPPHLFRKN